jgi:hypothetical protein
VVSKLETEFGRSTASAPWQSAKAPLVCCALFEEATPTRSSVVLAQRSLTLFTARPLHLLITHHRRRCRCYSTRLHTPATIAPYTFIQGLVCAEDAHLIPPLPGHQPTTRCHDLHQPIHRVWNSASKPLEGSLSINIAHHGVPNVLVLDAILCRAWTRTKQHNATGGHISGFHDHTFERASRFLLFRTAISVGVEQQSGSQYLGHRV